MSDVPDDESAPEQVSADETDHALTLEIERRSREGGSIIRLDLAGTIVFGVAAIIAVLFPVGFGPLFAGLSLLLFAVGVIAFLWSYGVAVSRSRSDLMGIGGLYFLADSAAKRVQLQLRGMFAAQCVVAIAAAAVRPFTAVAFGVLVPMFGLGLMGLWGARHGVFPRRTPESPG
jgi:hypothetical protein